MCTPHSHTSVLKTKPLVLHTSASPLMLDKSHQAWLIINLTIQSLLGTELVPWRSHHKGCVYPHSHTCVLKTKPLVLNTSASPLMQDKSHQAWLNYPVSTRYQIGPMEITPQRLCAPPTSKLKTKPLVLHTSASPFMLDKSHQAWLNYPVSTRHQIGPMEITPLRLCAPPTLTLVC